MAQVRYAGLFPFCVTPTTDGSLVGDGTWYPLGFTKEEVCALYWKNKSYNGSASESVDLNYTDDYSINYTRTANGDVYNYFDVDGGQFVPTIETDFVCADVITKQMLWVGPDLNNTGLVYLFGYEYINYIGFASLTTNCYYYNGLYYPALLLYTQNALTSYKGFAEYSGWTQEQVDLLSVSSTCTFLGKSVPLYWTGINPSVVPPQPDGSPDTTVYITGGTVSGSLVITLNEQWPYNP